MSDRMQDGDRPILAQPEDSNQLNRVLADAYGRDSRSLAKPNRGNPCVSNDNGFIVCGPLVGYQPPESKRSKRYSEQNYNYGGHERLDGYVDKQKSWSEQK